MLITKESSTRLAAERRASTDLGKQVSSVLRELNSVRDETKRLLDHRRQMEIYLVALKAELEQLRAERLKLVAGTTAAPPADDVEVAQDVDLVRRSKPIEAPEPRPGRITPPSDEDEDAFSAFLRADIDHDKSREWFLSDVGGS